MAASIDLGTNADRGIYGLNNDFLGYITRGAGTVYKLSYRIRLTFGATSEQYVYDIVPPANEVGIFNIVAPMRDYFRQMPLGDSGALSIAEGELMEYAYNSIQIEVGEVSASAADDPPTFGGYDTDDTLWFYNGWDFSDNNSPTWTNYREGAWHSASPIKIPLVKDEVRVTNEDNTLTDIVLPFFTYIPFDDGGDVELYAVEAVLTYSNSSGLLGTTNNSLPSFAGADQGVYNYGIGSQIITDLATYPTATQVGAVITYSEGEGLSEYSSETIVYKLEDCNPKYFEFMLSWQNRYCATEQQVFRLNNQKNINVNRGKTIVTDGINISAASFGASKNPIAPNKYNFGLSKETVFTLHSDYLTQDEVDALEDLYSSSFVVMHQSSSIGGTYQKRSVIVKDNTYEIKDIRNGLVKVSVRVEVLDGNKIQTQ